MNQRQPELVTSVMNKGRRSLVKAKKSLETRKQLPSVLYEVHLPRQVLVVFPDELSQLVQNASTELRTRLDKSQIVQYNYLPSCQRWEEETIDAISLLGRICLGSAGISLNHDFPYIQQFNRRYTPD